MDNESMEAQMEQTSFAMDYWTDDDAPHLRDKDCAPYLNDDEQCAKCRVSHSSECDECGGRGFHRASCSESEE